MAIEFLQAQKKQRNLIVILIVIVCAILLVFWWGFLRTPPVVPPSASPTTPLISSKIEINWAALQDAKLGALKAFAPLPELKEKVGRTNPFISY